MRSKYNIQGVINRQESRIVYFAKRYSSVSIVKDNTNLMRFNNELDAYKRLMSYRQSNSASPFPKLIDVFQDQQRLVIEHINCKSLNHFISFSEGISDKTQKLNIAIRFLEAATHFHDRGVAHLDLHPGNVLYSPQQNRLVLIDFDLAIVGKPSLTNVPNNYIRCLFTKETFYMPHVPSILLHSPELFHAGTINAIASDMYTISSSLIQIMWGIKPLLEASEKKSHICDISLLKYAIRGSHTFSLCQERILEQILCNLALNPNERTVTTLELKDSLAMLAESRESISVSTFPAKSMQYSVL